MKAAIYYGAKDVRTGEVPDPRIEEPSDAVVKGDGYLYLRL